MKRVLRSWVLASGLTCAAHAAVSSYEGKLTIPTYQHSAREAEPPLFANSTVTGMYPFTTYAMPFQPGPNPKEYAAVFVENEYLKLTYLPEFGGRIFSVYDKLRKREMLYRNDVIKPAPYNPRNSWPQSGLELTGPHDMHMLTLYGEPFWAHQIVKREDGGISLVLSETDPVYGMNVALTATLHPGVAALEIGVFCFNPRDAREPQMFWINTAISATPKTRFLYPMSRTVGHNTGDIADWPVYNGVDYSVDRNNQNMLGVFGIDIYDNFQGAYQFDRDYGIFRFADRRVVQGMKLWTFGYGAGAKNIESGYTDQAGPYVELQSGRHVWDGHYEWVAPHHQEGWSEWWIPVSQTGGLTTLTRDIALNLEVSADRKPIKLALESTRVVRNAVVTVKSQQAGELLRRQVDFDPAQTLHFELANAPVNALVVTVRDAKGEVLLDYHRPDTNPGRKEYTPFTKPLEQPRKAPEQMSAEELTLAAEYRLKELDEAGAEALFALAFKQDPGYSRAHLLLGVARFRAGRNSEAIQHLTQAIERDAYADAAYYYLAMAQFASGRDAEAERNLYYVWPESAYYGAREYHLGRLDARKRNWAGAARHFERSLAANANDLLSRSALAVALREQGWNGAALEHLATLDRINPANRVAAAERWLGAPSEKTRADLLRVLDGQSQEALSLAVFYRDLEQWKQAAQILHLVEQQNHDRSGPSPELYYTLAYCQRRMGDTAAADASLDKGASASRLVDRFPYRAGSEAPLAEAVRLRPQDRFARFDLACLLYFQKRPLEAIAQWEEAARLAPDDFATRRALGLAYAEQGQPVAKAAEQLERAVALNPAHIHTLNDLSRLYAQAGRFDDQLAVLNKARQRQPNDDDLAESAIAANLNRGRYDEAERIIQTHRFAPRHRTYTLREKYRILRYGLGAQAFAKGDFARAVQLFESAFTPPTHLGLDDFQQQPSPRLSYYIGRAREAMGRTAEAQAAYRKCIAGMESLTADRDSWNSENYFMVLALDRLGRRAEAERLEQHFANFADTEKDSPNPVHRSAARYLAGLIDLHRNRKTEATGLFQDALQAQPDLLPARLELRGDVVAAGPFLP